MLRSQVLGNSVEMKLQVQISDSIACQESTFLSSPTTLATMKQSRRVILATQVSFNFESNVVPDFVDCKGTNNFKNITGMFLTYDYPL